MRARATEPMGITSGPPLSGNQARVPFVYAARIVLVIVTQLVLVLVLVLLVRLCPVC